MNISEVITILLITGVIAGGCWILMTIMTRTARRTKSRRMERGLANYSQ